MSGKTILTKEQFKEISKSQCIILFPSDGLMVDFYRDQDGDYLATMTLFDDEGHQVLSGTTPIDYTLDEAYTMYVNICNLK